MAITGIEVHPAIEAVAAEEARWQAIGFVEPNRALREVGRAAELGGYYCRELRGTSDPAHIDDLKGIDPTPVDPTRALALRGNFDPHWRSRPSAAQSLGRLWVAGFFRDYGGGQLAGYRELPTDKHPDRVWRVTVEADGAFEVDEDDPTHTDNGRAIEWQRFRLPKSTPFAEHELRLASGERERRFVIGRESTVLSHVNSKLSDLVSKVEKEATEK